VKKPPPGLPEGRRWKVKSEERRVKNSISFKKKRKMKNSITLYNYSFKCN